MPPRRPRKALDLAGEPATTTPAVPAAARFARFYVEPIGPASIPIQVGPTPFGRGWLGEAESALERVERALDELGHGASRDERARAGESGRSAAGEDQDERAVARCSVVDLKHENEKWYHNAYYRSELNKAFEDELYGEAVSSLNRDRKRSKKAGKRGGQGSSDEDDEEGPTSERGGSPDSPNVQTGRGGTATGGAKGKGKVSAEGTGPEPQGNDDERGKLDEDVARLVAEGRRKSLSLLRPLDAKLYIRKTKTNDYNSIPELRLANPKTVDQRSLRAPLANIVLTLTFHAVARVTGKVYTVPQQQTLVCLASNTLAELRANLNVNGDAVPVEVDDEDEDGSVEAGSEDSDSSSSAGHHYRRKDSAQGRRETASPVPDRRRASGVFLEAKPDRPVEWKAKRRVTGAVFAVEGVLYADVPDGAKDYAKMFLDAIEAMDWSATGEHDGLSTDAREKSEEPASPINPRSNDISVHSTPAPEPLYHIDPSLVDLEALERANLEADRAARPRSGEGAWVDKPKYRAGSTTMETRLGDLPLRVGQPYWYVHQGNAEHVWTVDEIRWRHPSDPNPTSTPSPYPLTTFLSRLAASKCYVCDRDPGSIWVHNDELAGQNPTLVCRTCFKHLHPVRGEDVPVEQSGGGSGAKSKARRPGTTWTTKRKAADSGPGASRDENGRTTRRRANRSGTGGEADDEEDDVPPLETEAADFEPDREFLEGVRVIPTVLER
ncbi:hypothetical protein JCM10212_002219 [Sporobolomyces blumeae]